MSFDFETLLVWIVIISGILSLADSIILGPKRIRRFHAAVGDTLPVEEKISDRVGFLRSIFKTIPFSLLALLRLLTVLLFWQKDWYWKRLQKKREPSDPAMQHKKLLNPPLLLEYCRSFFPVLFLVLVLRSFLFEPYLIPSPSLEPTLLPGDFILVNKFDYGLRWPLTHGDFVPGSTPKTGDIVVFRVPTDPTINYIKRTIGVPGDTISYINKVLYINGQEQKQTFIMQTTDRYTQRPAEVRLYEEDLQGVKHKIYINPLVPTVNFYDLKVPPGYYFMMGDNRDDSADSRYWGYMPEENIIGKASLIWFSKEPHQFAFRFRRIGERVR